MVQMTKCSEQQGGIASETEVERSHLNLTWEGQGVRPESEVRLKTPGLSLLQLGSTPRVPYIPHSTNYRELSFQIYEPVEDERPSFKLPKRLIIICAPSPFTWGHLQSFQIKI